MTVAENISRLDDAMAGRNQPAPINAADLRNEVQGRRDQVLDRLAVVRVAKAKNAEQRAALDDHDEALTSETRDLEAMADAMLNEMHAFDRMMQGR